MPSLRVAYVDTETTGLSPHSDHLIEVAIVLAEVDWDSGHLLRRLDQYEALQDPGCAIPAAAMAVHGITDAMVKGHRIDVSRLGTLLGAADLCLAHNSGFDRGFVAQVFPLAPELTWGCTCRGLPWKRWFPPIHSTGLQKLSRFFGSPTGTAHRALGDVETMINLVTLPGLLGGRAFQHHLLHRKVQREALNVAPVSTVDPGFQLAVFP